MKDGFYTREGASASVDMHNFQENVSSGQAVRVSGNSKSPAYIKYNQIRKRDFVLIVVGKCIIDIWCKN